jgi:hypothetical protein
MAFGGPGSAVQTLGFTASDSVSVVSVPQYRDGVSSLWLGADNDTLELTLRVEYGEGIAVGAYGADSVLSTRVDTLVVSGLLSAPLTLGVPVDSLWIGTTSRTVPTPGLTYLVHLAFGAR